MSSTFSAPKLSDRHLVESEFLVQLLDDLTDGRNGATAIAACAR